VSRLKSGRAARLKSRQEPVVPAGAAAVDTLEGGPDRVRFVPHAAAGARSRPGGNARFSVRGGRL